MAPKLDSLTREQLVEEVRRLRRTNEELVGWLTGLTTCEAVCEALLAHVKHGGGIPWPSVSRPFDAWREAVGR